MGREAAEEAGYGDVDAAFKAADYHNRRDGVPAVPRTSAARAALVDGLLAERQAVPVRLHAKSSAQTVAMRQRSWCGIRVRPMWCSSANIAAAASAARIRRAHTMAIPAMLAKKTNRPVMMRISREEESSSGARASGNPGRGSRSGFRKDGRIVGHGYVFIEDAGPVCAARAMRRTLPWCASC